MLPRTTHGAMKNGQEVNLRSSNWTWTSAVIASVLAITAVIVGISVGAASIPPFDAIAVIVDHLPFVDLHPHVTQLEAAVIWEIRFPRVVLGLIVGATLAVSGAAYQGVFRNPLADPYLLGVAAGAGLGATIAIVMGLSGGSVRWGGIGPITALPITEFPLSPLPLLAFVGAMGAVFLTYTVSRTAGAGAGASAGVAGKAPSMAVLLLGGVAVSSLLTAVQTFIQQSHDVTIRQVYSWLLGRLSTASWHDVALVLPYFVVSSGVIIAHRRVLDVLSVGDEEATTLGINVARVRLTIVIAASLGTAAAVSVSGLIGFVGIIVPHAVRLMRGVSYRSILPLSIIGGGAFMVFADLIARTVMAPAEIPIGVITAFIGAPFFLLVMRMRES